MLYRIQEVRTPIKPKRSRKKAVEGKPAETIPVVETEKIETRYDLVEVRTGDVVFTAPTRAGVLGEKKKLESWRERNKKRWN